MPPWKCVESSNHKVNIVTSIIEMTDCYPDQNQMTGLTRKSFNRLGCVNNAEVGRVSRTLSVKSNRSSIPFGTLLRFKSKLRVNRNFMRSIGLGICALALLAGSVECQPSQQYVSRPGPSLSNKISRSVDSQFDQNLAKDGSQPELQKVNNCSDKTSYIKPAPIIPITPITQKTSTKQLPKHQQTQTNFVFTPPPSSSRPKPQSLNTPTQQPPMAKLESSLTKSSDPTINSVPKTNLQPANVSPSSIKLNNVYGQGNDVLGKNNLLLGDQNNVYGVQNLAAGHHNYIQGGSNAVLGDNAMVQGSLNTVMSRGIDERELY